MIWLLIGIVATLAILSLSPFFLSGGISRRERGEPRRKSR